MQKPESQAGKWLEAATGHLVHRTVRVALNEAVGRGNLAANPARIVKRPRVEDDEIVPFTMDEARRVIKAACAIRNGARYVIALTLGLRRGEALGLQRSDIDTRWRHGCPIHDRCRQELPQQCR